MSPEEIDGLPQGRRRAPLRFALVPREEAELLEPAPARGRRTP